MQRNAARKDEEANAAKVETEQVLEVRCDLCDSGLFLAGLALVRKHGGREPGEKAHAEIHELVLARLRLPGEAIGLARQVTNLRQSIEEARFRITSAEASGSRVHPELRALVATL